MIFNLFWKSSEVQWWTKVTMMQWKCWNKMVNKRYTVWLKNVEIRERRKVTSLFNVFSKPGASENVLTSQWNHIHNHRKHRIIYFYHYQTLNCSNLFCTCRQIMCLEKDIGTEKIDFNVSWADLRKVGIIGCHLLWLVGLTIQARYEICNTNCRF